MLIHQRTIIFPFPYPKLTTDIAYFIVPRTTFICLLTYPVSVLSKTQLYRKQWLSCVTMAFMHEIPMHQNKTKYNDNWTETEGCKNAILQSMIQSSNKCSRKMERKLPTDTYSISQNLNTTFQFLNTIYKFIYNLQMPIPSESQVKGNWTRKFSTLFPTHNLTTHWKLVSNSWKWKKIVTQRRCQNLLV